MSHSPKLLHVCALHVPFLQDDTGKGVRYSNFKCLDWVWSWREGLMRHVNSQPSANWASSLVGHPWPLSSVLLRGDNTESKKRAQYLWQVQSLMPSGSNKPAHLEPPALWSLTFKVTKIPLHLVTPASCLAYSFFSLSPSLLYLPI